MEESNADEQSIDTLIGEGERLAQEGKLDEAEEVFKKAVEHDPDNPLTNYNLSVLYLMRLKQDLEKDELWEDYCDDESYLEEAITHCQTALELDEKFVSAHNNLGTLYALRGWKEKAIIQLEESLSIQPDQPDIRDDLIVLREEV